MPFGTGSVTLKRLKVLPRGEMPTEAWVFERMRRHMVRPIGLEDAETESTGWCHPFTGEAELGDPNNLIYGDAFVFGMRTDTKKIPTTLLRLQLRNALAALAKEAGEDADGNPKRIPKKIREAARERIEQELLSHTLPTIRLVEAVWHIQSGEVWLSTASKGVIESFSKLFWETFELGLVQLNPGTAAVDFERLFNDSDYSLEKLFDLVPVTFISPESVGAALAASAPSLAVAADA